MNKTAKEYRIELESLSKEDLVIYTLKLRLYTELLENGTLNADDIQKYKESLMF